tara:strand:+ start:39 stop:560 length:522 start_codon:yes stop_codon:yes gene_type:complete
MAIYFSDEAQARAAHVINYTRLTDNTRRSLGGSSNNQEMLAVDFGNVNKKESSSILVFQGFLAGWSAEAGAITCNLRVGGSHANYVLSGGTSSGYPIVHYAYNGRNLYQLAVISGHINGHTSTGNQSVNVGYRSANGGGNKIFGLINPNASDDGRIENSMGGSSLSIWEIYNV